MKFRAVIRDSISIKDFFNIITTLSKCGKDFIFHALPDRLVVSVNTDSPHTALPMWCDLDKERFFAEYHMEGLSQTHNGIILLMNSASLLRGLSVSRQTTYFVKLKLMNKNMACLCVEMEVPSSEAVKNRSISHDVPVTVVSKRDWSHYELPKLPHFGMVVGMPNIRVISNIIENMKSSSPVMSVRTAKDGTVSFISESPMAKISCHCREQEVVSQGEDDEVICRIESKRLALFLLSSQFLSSAMRCSISAGHLVRFEVKIQDRVNLTCIITATD